MTERPDIRRRGGTRADQRHCILDADGKMIPRIERFCQEYIVDFNGSAAALRAGFPGKKSARVRACELLATEPVQQRVAALLAERAERTAITADEVIRGIHGVATRCSAAETFDASGANRAWELLGKHLGIFERDNAQRRPMSEAERIAAVDAEIEEMMARGNPRDGAATRH